MKTTVKARVTVRPLTSAEQALVSAARLIAVEAFPYLASGVFAMRAVAVEGLGTLAVDKHWRLYIDPDMLEEFPAEVIGTCLLHEVNHLLRDHHGRARDLTAPVNYDTWNVATDAAINDDLLAANLPLPEWVVTPAACGLEPGGVEEIYYYELATRPPDEDAGTGGDGDGGDGAAGGCGSGAGDPTPVWELPLDSPIAPGQSAEDGVLTRRAVATATREHAQSKGRGTIPAGLERWAEDVLAPPSVPWQSVLAAAIRKPLGMRAGMRNYSYSRPGRRQVPRVVTPAMVRPVLSAAIVVDTSGSMGPAELNAAMSEVSGVLAQCGITGSGVAVLSCDAEASAVTRVRSVQDVKLVGGGGTDMCVGIDAAQALAPHRPDVIVVLTDGMTPWPQEPTRAALVIVLVGDSTEASSCPDWATVVRVPSAA